MRLRLPFTGSCEETSELLSDYVEGELGRRLRRRVGRHLAKCRRCKAVWKTLVAAMSGLRSLGVPEPAAEPAFAEAVIARIRAEESDGT